MEFVIFRLSIFRNRTQIATLMQYHQWGMNTKDQSGGKRMQVKSFPGRMFKWEPQTNALAGSVLGLVIFFLSVAMIYLRRYVWVSIIIRDLVMILLLGTGIPLLVINKEQNYQGYGLHFKKWYLYLPLNLLLGFLLLLLLLKAAPLPADFVLTTELIWEIVYIMLAGVFETIAFYSFIRTVIERSLGIIPAILITAVFYSFHHAGFQPEFGKLLLVGILYATVFRIGNSALLIFPFFWGVGACYDVIIQSQKISAIIYPELRAVILMVGIGLIVNYLVVKKHKYTSELQDEEQNGE